MAAGVRSCGIGCTKRNVREPRGLLGVNVDAECQMDPQSYTTQPGASTTPGVLLPTIVFKEVTFGSFVVTQRHLDTNRRYVR